MSKAKGIVQANRRDPAVYQPGILPRPRVRRRMNSAREQKIRIPVRLDRRLLADEGRRYGRPPSPQRLRPGLFALLANLPTPPRALAILAE